jgi:poly-gamma-glutamate synthesis protein (capsule biosynthesis protein)
MVPAERPEPTTTTTTTLAHLAEGPTVSVLLVGDVMLGRGVAWLVRSDPAGVFEDVRHVVTDADIAAANLESPLTLRLHIATNPYALEADPASAGSLAEAGFDLVGLANNHAGDAGRLSIIDTIEAAEATGLKTVGGGANVEAAYEVRILENDGLEVGFLAFDATLAGTAATDDNPGIASWDEGRVRSAVESARADVDVLVVGVHGGVEYYRETDPGMAVLADKLAGWGVDIVWGHGPHVMQPVYLTSEAGEGTTVVATSLGNFLFDQSAAGTQDGALLEVLADRQGVLAYRVGTAGHHDRRVHFDGWALPEGNAVLLGLDWWNLVRAPALAPDRSDGSLVAAFPGGDVVDSAIGDVTGDNQEDVVISHRRPYEANGVNSQYPDRQWADARGRSAHLGVYQPADFRELWVAGTLFRPIARVAVCDGSVALAFDSLDDPAVVATGAWVWEGFGFTVPAELAGTGTPGCIDVDGDGRLDPVIVDRS